MPYAFNDDKSKYDLDEVISQINNARSLFIDSVYPVGSIYMSVNGTSPANLFGGTWEQIKDTFLLSAGSTYKAGSTGGEATHELTVNEIPEHNHWVWKNPRAGIGNGSYGNEAYLAQSIVTTDGRYGYTSNTGGGTAHNNMPPYLTVYMWKRTG